MNKAIFLDRDGVINEDTGFVHKIEGFKIIDGTFHALRNLQSAGYLLFIISNQSGIGRGYFKKSDINILTKHLLKTLNNGGIKIEKVYYCPHHPDDNCYYRKPSPGMIIKAIKEFNIDPSQSWFIGDKTQDKQAGEAAGCKALLIKSRYQKEFDVEDIKEATDYILSNER